MVKWLIRLTKKLMEPNRQYGYPTSHIKLPFFHLLRLIRHLPLTLATGSARLSLAPAGHAAFPLLLETFAVETHIALHRSKILASFRPVSRSQG
jgi:hypothetical protein